MKGHGGLRILVAERLRGRSPALSTPLENFIPLCSLFPPGTERGRYIMLNGCFFLWLVKFPRIAFAALGRAWARCLSQRILQVCFGVQRKRHDV